MITLNILGIENTDNILDKLPVEQNIEVITTASVYKPENNIFVLRREPQTYAPSTADIFKSVKGYFDLNNYEYEPLEFSQEVFDVNKNKIIINPTQPLVNNYKYTLFISKEIIPVFYTINKTVSTGPSTLEPVVNLSSPILGAEKREFIFTITHNSQLTSSTHLIGFTLTENVYDATNTLIVTNPIATQIGFDINTNTEFELNDYFKVKFNNKVPYITNESWTINLDKFNKQIESITKEIETVDTPKIKTYESESQVATYEDLVQFYRDTGTDPQPPKTPNYNYTWRFIRPNKIVILFEEDQDMSHIIKENIEFSITEAFGNYLLEHMGLYDPNKFYDVILKIKNNKRIDIEIVENLSNTENKIYIYYYEISKISTDFIQETPLIFTIVTNFNLCYPVNKSACYRPRYP